MEHYVCKGDCSGESHKLAVCKTAGCSREGLPLEECLCEDGLHKEVKISVDSDALEADDELDVEVMDDKDDL
jgi:hypothetical protein